MWKISMIAMMVVFSALSGVAQTSKSQTEMFAVKGTAVDTKGNPLGFSLVYLQDTHSRMLRIRRAGRDGHFTFSVLNGQADYEIYAERDNLRSERVLISGSKKAPEVLVTLKLNRDQ